MENKETFVMFRSNIDVIKKLPTDAEKLEMLYAIANYSMTGIVPQFKSLTCELIFISIRPNIDSVNKRYTASVENGKKGGAPKGTTPWNKGKKKSEPKANPSEPSSNQVEPNANLYVSVSVSDDVSVYEDVYEDDNVSVSVSEQNRFVSWKEIDEYLKENNLEFNTKGMDAKMLFDTYQPFIKGDLQKQIQIIKNNTKQLQTN
jgi:hypothetical protein